MHQRHLKPAHEEKFRDQSIETFDNRKDVFRLYINISSFHKLFFSFRVKSNANLKNMTLCRNYK